MKKKAGIALAAAIGLGILISMIPVQVVVYEKSHEEIIHETVVLAEPLLREERTPNNDEVRAFLESKNSPLATHTETLLKQEHWKLIIAVSAIESTYCQRQLGNNCWGITNTSGGYKTYDSFDDAIIDVNGLITRWQARGRWLTVEDMNCHYVVPCNPNWVYVVNDVLSQLDTL